MQEKVDLWKMENQINELNENSIRTLKDILDELEEQELITLEERNIIENTRRNYHRNKNYCI